MIGPGTGVRVYLACGVTDTTELWQALLQDFVDDAELIARIKAKSTR